MTVTCPIKSRLFKEFLRVQTEVVMLLKSPCALSFSPYWIGSVKKRRVSEHLYLKSLYKSDELSLPVQCAELISGSSSVIRWNHSWFCTQPFRWSSVKKFSVFQQIAIKQSGGGKCYFRIYMLVYRQQVICHPGSWKRQF